MRLAKAITEGPPHHRPPKGRPVGLTSDPGTAAPAVGGPTGSWTPPAESFTWGAFALASGLVVAGAGAYEGVSGWERDIPRVYSSG